MHLQPDDRDPGKEKVTNADEQEVAVNQSTSPEGGYDEPAHVSSALEEQMRKKVTAEEAKKEVSPSSEIKPTN